MTKLKLISINMQSIVNHFTRIATQLMLNEQAPDVLMMSETWLKAEHSLSLTGYEIIRNDRSGVGGGTAIAIKNSIKYKRVTCNRTASLEISAVEILHEDDSNYCCFNL